MRPITLTPGTIVDGFRIEAALGSGSVGEVYAASAVDGERVALKIMHAEYCAVPAVIERFRREWSIGNRIASPFVVKARHAKVAREGRHYIAFDLLEGESLDRALERRRRLPLAEVERLVSHVLKGLAAAHAAGIIHRDIKPSNLFLEGARGSWTRARILDFGISKVGEQLARTPLTKAGDTIGTLAYMPPEQIRGSADVDSRADLYALGVVIFRCLCAKWPFAARDASHLRDVKVREEPSSLTQATGLRWPDALERFLQRLLARDRDARFVSADEALAAWQRTCRTLDPVDVPHVGVPDDASFEGGSATTPDDESTPRL